MNTVAYVLRLCCRGAEAARLLALGKAAASHQGCREHPAERPGRGTDPLAAHPEVTRAKKGLELGYPTAAVLPCASPQIHFPPGPLQAGDSGGAPVLHPRAGDTPGGRRFPDSTVPRGMSTKTARSGPSPPGALSSGRGRELGAVSINSPCPKWPHMRGGGGWTGGARSRCLQLGWRRLAALGNHPEGARGFPRQAF